MDGRYSVRGEGFIDYSDSQMPPSDNDFYVDPQYPSDLCV